MKKILVIGALPPPTGGMTTVMEQMSSLKFKNYDIIIFNVAKNKIIKSNIVFNVINFIYRCIKLFLVLVIYNPYIVHIHMSSYKDFSQKRVFHKICKLLNKKTILHIHGGAFIDFYNTSNNKKSIVNTLNSADLLIVLSDYWKDFFKKLCPDKKIVVLPNAVDMKISNKYSKISKNDKTYNVLFVGRLEKQKGIFDLIKAFNMIKDDNIKLLLMGPFMNNEKEIKDLIKKLNISDKIVFLGNINSDERFKYFASADVFVLPSYFEGLPVAILEAMSFGLPVISTNVGAIPEVVKKDNGILIKPGDVKALKNAILKIKNNTKIDYKKNNIEKIKKNYTLDIFKKKLEEVYEKI